MEFFEMNESVPLGTKPGSMLKVWWVALRPFSFPASIVPVVLGTIAGVSVGKADFQAPLFFLALVGMLSIHAGANLWNDVWDYKKGIDNKVLPVSGAIVRKLITPREAIAGAFSFLALGAICGIIIALNVGLPIVLIGALGMGIAVIYSAGSLGLKYNFLGDPAVFLSFGILGTLGAWTVQTGRVSLFPVLAAIPISIQVIAILHANNWRDMEADIKAGCRTIAQKLGDKGSETYFKTLILSPYAFVVLFALANKLAGWPEGFPAWSLLVLVTMPMALGLMKKAERRKDPENAGDFLSLDGQTARFNLVFGLIYMLSFLF